MISNSYPYVKKFGKKGWRSNKSRKHDQLTQVAIKQDTVKEVQDAGKQIVR